MASGLRKITNTLLCRQDDIPENRTIFVNHKPPPTDDVYFQQKFPDNQIISSKYTIITFLPKNLFEQFRRIANFYFLLVAILQLAIDSPVSPITSIFPLVFVISVTAIKQAYEDWLRHKADNEVNKRPTQVVRDCQIKEVQSQQIHVGDIVKVMVEEELPCDMVLLSSQSEDGECYVTTANLDGETNLKIFRSLPDTAILQDEESLDVLSAMVECEQPQPDLYKFIGRMRFYTQNQQPTVRSLTAENVLLRGSRLKNTPFVYGVAIYTGRETKMALNSRQKGQKHSCIEGSMNKYLVAMLVWLLVQTSIVTGLKFWTDRRDFMVNSWYVHPVAEALGDLSGSGIVVFTDFLSFLVLFNYIIPISLYVTIELQKFLGSLYFGWDLDIYDPKADLRAKANTSDLNEELGQVEYMFTDKTGTLTENDMQFRQCSVDGIKYVEEEGKLVPDKESVATPEAMKEFLLCMALCHTVHVNKDQGGDEVDAPNAYEDYTQWQYEASSPDEKALVEATRRFGVVLTASTQEYSELMIEGDLVRFQLLHVLEFDPTRKCMSVIIRTPEGNVQVLCKGAESTILARSVTGQKDIILDHVNDYAVLGLRTLCFAKRELSYSEYENFHDQLQEASTALESREEKLTQVFNDVEQELHLLGATGVEDKLQDGVPETIEALRIAGIKVWVLTGDKQETAVNISHSCKHFQPHMQELMLVKQANAQECGETLWRFLEQMKAEPKVKYAMVVDGPSLFHALEHHKDTLRDLCLNCVAVLCCRMSPLQKAEVVKLVKFSDKRPTTMAIGDGANDVSMIQEAHIGLGIMGKEGRQAVRCSDYAFSRFRFLIRVLLVHGAWYYNRIAITVQYFFYKNVAFITAQFFYAFYSAFSEQTIYDSFYLTLFNITYTSLPILIYGIVEQHLSSEMLVENPRLYREIQKNAKLTWIQCVYWLALGMLHAVVIYYFTMLVFKNDASLYPDQKNMGNWSFGTILYTCCILIANIKLGIETRCWNWITIGAMAISILAYPVLTSIYTAFVWYNVFGGWNFFDTTTVYYVFFMSLKSLSVWFLILLVIGACFLPDFVYKTCQLYFFPSESQIAHKAAERPSPEATVHTILEQDRSVSPGVEEPSKHPTKLTPLAPKKPVGFNSQGRLNPAFEGNVASDAVDEGALTLGTYKLAYQREEDQTTKTTPITVL
ncbi:probable phospholipid-transporting ATPase IF isoform X2 [Acanthaster planci]|uniref:Phospholipid-transporting ATPase n=1 Tax=Acanthaster planci TaxID=133434 RepID=A0A8B7YRM6_ACAPL|nr:probable phospholipid-transporting ATPase IF isoform X2 [Acanthaster planci]